ncbi:MAG: POTRA domain-containing protein, partial [Ignavibacteriaceae bacterium]
MLKLILAFLFIASIENCVGQSIAPIPLASEKFIVDSIEVNGNEITEKEIILRELTFEKGDTVSARTLSYNRERVYSLGIFTNVNISKNTIENVNVVDISVKEGWYIYPIPLFQLKDGDWEKISYGFDVQLKNFRGRNENLRARSLFGYNKSFLL